MLVALLVLSLGIPDVLQRDVTAGERICDAAGLRTFYARREMRPAWNAASIDSLLRAIDRLENDGLAPRRYHRDALTRTAGAERDVLATDAFLTAAAPLSRGVTDPQFVRPMWCAPPPRLDLAAILQSALEEVIVNPWWIVPDSIATKELWPKQRRDPSYFAREHMVVMNGRIRQRPGEWNALGRLKFNMPNQYNVYLHDTPAKQLFARSFRAFSHGCIRLERPMDLALHLLRDQPKWTRDAIESDIAADIERTIRLTSPRPVYVLYWTAWVGDDGNMEFHRDHYERDAALAAALR